MKMAFKAKAVIDMAKKECPVTAYINSIPKWNDSAVDITDNQQKQQPQIAAPLSSSFKVSLESKYHISTLRKNET